MAESAADLAAAVRLRRQQLDRLAGQAEQVAVQGKEAEAAVAELRADMELYAREEALLTSIAEDAQETARREVEQLATRALQVVFSEQLSFRLVPGERGGQAVLDPVVRSDYAGAVTETPVLEGRGGGLAQVIGFVLRLVVVLLSPDLRNIMLLDETFAHVDVGRTAAVAEFLREVADKARMQMVLVTHDPVYAQFADRHVRLVLHSDGVTRVREEEGE